MRNRNAVRRQTQGLLAVRRCYDPYLIYCWADTAISAGKLRKVCGERYARDVFNRCWSLCRMTLLTDCRLREPKMLQVSLP
jgi:hypothetical protein